jgi:putative PIN family toxin of toxin-antitoxin system
VRAVLDTNVLISALFWGGRPGEVVAAAVAGRFRAVTSPELLAEFETVMVEDFGLPPDRAILALVDVLSYSHVVLPVSVDDITIRDITDAKVVACAIAGDADFIVTGDRDLLALRGVRSVAVLTVRAFLDRLIRQRPEQA